MAIELHLSVMNMERGEEKLNAALDAFGAEHDVSVKLSQLDWAEGWGELSRYAANEKSPDVSEVGSTWLPGLVAMNAAPPFFASELAQVENGDIFFKRAWQGVFIKDRAYSIPWFCDARLLYYRRDLLEKLNLAPEQAFSSPDAFYDTLNQMHQAGIPKPWALPTLRYVNNVHMVASWIWGYGGDFVSPDGKKVILDQPEALHGIARYYETIRFMDDELLAAGISDNHLQDLYLQGQLSMFPSGPWMATGSIQRGSALVQENWAVSPMPGASFVGGTQLMIWRYSRKRDLALKLVQYLTSEAVQSEVFVERNMLPANERALDARQDMKHIQHIMTALRTGKTFPALSYWSKLEDRLVAELNGIWADVLSIPAGGISYDEIRKIVDSRVPAFVRRFNLAISS